jgi:hypothetical protein
MNEVITVICLFFGMCFIMVAMGASGTWVYVNGLLGFLLVVIGMGLADSNSDDEDDKDAVQRKRKR